MYVGQAVAVALCCNTHALDHITFRNFVKHFCGLRHAPGHTTSRRSCRRLRHLIGEFTYRQQTACARIKRGLANRLFAQQRQRPFRMIRQVTYQLLNGASHRCHEHFLYKKEFISLSISMYVRICVSNPTRDV